MKTYAFPIEIGPDEDGWLARCPVLETHGGAAWGNTREEAVRNIESVVRMVVESLAEHGELIPEPPQTFAGIAVKVEYPSPTVQWRLTSGNCGA